MKEDNHSNFDEQLYFAQELNQITPRYIPTSYGQVYSITAGTPGQPLILIVHGSGPKNSSDQYKYLLHQYLVRISYIQKFYLVGIDCPGYGKSIGSKQAVKTFPKQLFQQILVSLKYKQYYAMMGHSQGGAAIFNACYQNPSLCEFMLMDRPVCGNIQRFKKFNIPTLLIYDIQDDGHPIWQGKLLYNQLAYSQLYTYRQSENAYWVPDNIWDKILQFIEKYYNRNNRKNRISQLNKNRFVSQSTQIKKKSTNNKIKFQKIQQSKSKDVSLYQSQKFIVHKQLSLDSKIKDIKLIQKLNKNTFDLEKIKQTQKQDLISIYSNSLSEQQKIQLKEIQQQMKLKQQEFLKDEIKGIRKQDYKNSEIDQNVIIGNIEKKYKNNQKIEKIINYNMNQHHQLKKSQEQKQKYVNSNQQKDLLCSICYQTYYRPMQTNCHHIFCTKCLIESILVNDKCPLCRTIINKKTQRKDINQKIQLLMSSEEICKRQKAYLKLKLMLDSIVYIQIGNRSIQLDTKKSLFTKTKKKYNWEIFVKEKPNFKFQQVLFNVNMGNDESKPVRVKSAPFVFQSRGTFSFSCEIVIKPRNKQYAPLTIVYRINVQPGTHSKVVALRKKIYS